MTDGVTDPHLDRNVVKLAQNHHHTRDGVGEKKRWCERKKNGTQTCRKHTSQSCDFYTPRVRWLDGYEVTETRVREIKEIKDGMG